MYQPSADDRQDSFRVLKWVALIADTKAELLVLSQFAYWFGESKKGKLRAKIQRKGYWWVYKTHSQLAKELDLTRHQVRGAVRSLVETKILVADDDKKGGHVVYYRLDAAKIAKRAEKRREELRGGKTRKGRKKRPGGKAATTKKEPSTSKAATTTKPAKASTRSRSRGGRK